MKKPLHIKKLVLPNIPYVFIALFATKLGQAWRLAPGTDFSGKALHLMEGFATAFSSLVPSFHPIDLCVEVRFRFADEFAWQTDILRRSQIREVV